MLTFQHFLLLLFVALIACNTSASDQMLPTEKRIASLGRVGNPEDIQTPTLPGIVLMGGGPETDQAMQWMIERSGGGDFVVIRTTERNGHNNYLYELGKLNSVETFQINSRELANNPTVAGYIRSAEALFIAGGDQAEYVNFWKGTLLAEAVNYLIKEKKVPVGGTSAGCAILGEISFSALAGTIRSEEALKNPYHPSVTLNIGDFLDAPPLQNIITDTHYDNPDRRGRQMVFLARMFQDSGRAIRGIGLQERTALCVDENGIASVFGERNAYFLKPGTTPPENCTVNQPLTWEAQKKAVRIHILEGSPQGTQKFDLAQWIPLTSEDKARYFYVLDGSLQLFEE